MKNLQRELQKIKKRTALIVFPHPDDESVMAGGLIARLISLGWKVVVICLTRGERGKIHINGSGLSLAEIRGEEFSRAMGHLGVSEYELFNFPDGELRGKTRWQGVLKGIVGEVNPGLLVSYDPSGITGHPDHTALAVFLLEQFKKRRGIKMWWPVLSGKAKELIADTRVADLLPAASLRLNLTVAEVMRKWRAISAHASQGWTKVGAVWLCLGWLMRHRYEEYAEASPERTYPHRYVKFKF